MDIPTDDLQPKTVARPRRGWPWLAILLVGVTLAVYGLHRWQALTPPPPGPRVIVIGLDGLEPKLVEQWAAAGKLPNFQRFIADGQFHRLATSLPAQSPVSWSCFISGSNPGKHGIFDFLSRDPHTYLPDLTLVRQSEPGTTVEVGKWVLPILSAEFDSARKGSEFWQLLEDQQIPTRIIHCPITFPPTGSGRMLSGMGVPDIRGTQGTFTFYTDTDTLGKDVGGALTRLVFSDGRARAEVTGPQNALEAGQPPVTLPLMIVRADNAVTLTTGDTTVTLAPGEWSGWIRFSFPLGMGQSVSAIGRFHLAALEPFGLYLSPLQFDPANPYQPISIPTGYAKELADEFGPYHTLGMPEETWGLNEGRLSEEAFLAQCDLLLIEQEAMLDRELRDFDGGLLVWVTMVSDRIQHMYWRTLDPQHPLYSPELAAKYGEVIEKLYVRLDALVGKVRAQLREGDVLIVMSDHGFSSFRRAAHINSFLRDHQFLTLKAGSDTSAEFFERVDWSRTRAYALGLGGVYLNRAGREGQGIVRTDAEADALKQLLTTVFATWRDGEHQVVANVYDSAKVYHGPYRDEGPDLVLGFSAGYRASWQTALGAVPRPDCEDNLKKWSGDHLIDPPLVPGLLCVTHNVARPAPAIVDLAPTVLKFFGVATPAEMDGAPLW